VNIISDTSSHSPVHCLLQWGKYWSGSISFLSILTPVLNGHKTSCPLSRIQKGKQRKGRTQRWVKSRRKQKMI